MVKHVISRIFEGSVMSQNIANFVTLCVLHLKQCKLTRAFPCSDNKHVFCIQTAKLTISGAKVRPPLSYSQEVTL